MKAYTPASIDHVRLFDLVRQARGTLHEENLITDEEYAWLSGGSPLATDQKKNGSPSPRRLEDYDDLRDQLTALQAKVERLTFIGNTLRLDLEIDPSIASDDTPKMVQALQEALSSLRTKFSDQLATREAYIKKLDGLIEEVGGITVSCINPYEDLKRALVALKTQRDTMATALREISNMPWENSESPYARKAREALVGIL